MSAVNTDERLHKEMSKRELDLIKVYIRDKLKL